MTAEGPFVVDANVAVKWFVPEPLSDRAVALLHGSSRLIAPQFLLAEFGSVMRKKRLKGEIESDQAGLAIQDVLDLVELFPIEDLLDAAWNLTVRYDSSFYDALYVALALRHGYRLVTSDDKLMRGMGSAFADAFLPLTSI